MNSRGLVQTICFDPFYEVPFYEVAARAVCAVVVVTSSKRLRGVRGICGLPLLCARQHAERTMRPHSLLLLALSLGLVVSFSHAQTEIGGEFERQTRLAHEAVTRDDKVEHLQAALKARPDHPDNIALEFEIASLLQTDTTGNQPIKPRAALAIYERILKTYHYDEYYRSHYEEGDGGWKLRQSLFVQSAIQAGCIHSYVLRNPDKAREYLYSAIEMLNSTLQRRKADWLNEPQLKAPQLAEIEKLLGREGERARLGYEYSIKQWMQRKEQAKNGDVLERMELENARVAVKHYGLSYGNQPELVPVPMRRIIADFPDTPMARIAQEHIDRASELAEKRLSPENRSGTE